MLNNRFNLQKKMNFVVLGLKIYWLVTFKQKTLNVNKEGLLIRF